MKIITKIIEVYEFSELNEASKMKAINDYINFLLEALPYEDMTENMRKACDKFAGSFIVDYCIDELQETLQNCYEFLADGSIYSDN